MHYSTVIQHHTSVLVPLCLYQVKKVWRYQSQG